MGSRLGETDWWGREPYWNQKNLKVIQVDIDPQIIGSSRNITLGIISDVKAFLIALLEQKLSFKFKWNELLNKIEQQKNSLQKN